MENKTEITIEALINAPVDKVWAAWNNPDDIMQWNMATPEWHCPAATNDLREGGAFNYTMAARDGSMSFDFAGVYTTVRPEEHIAYAMSDGREVRILFKVEGSNTRITETFDAEMSNPLEMQRAGWQSILNNFKAHVEKTQNS